jgi:bla regulator protein blaR1
MGMRNTLLVVAILSGYGVPGLAQAPESPPAFEVATIKRSGPASAPISMQRLPGGRFVTSNASLTMLIKWAYQLDEGRLLGATRELDSTRFDVVAKAPEQDPVPGRMQMMMRALLAERFKLVVHHEARELTAYTLVTDTGGPKVRASSTTEPAGPNPFRMSDSGSLMGTRVTADMLATVLSNQLGRPVQNMTAFTGAFDFVLRWTPDTATAPTSMTRIARLYSRRFANSSGSAWWRGRCPST